MILVQGIRSGDDFIVKKYNNAGMEHQLYKIDSITENGDLVIRNYRAQGDAEDEV